MVSEKKKKTVKELKAELKNWPVIGILDFHGLPARSLFQIKQKLIGKAYRMDLIWKKQEIKMF